MPTMSTGQARSNLSESLNRVAYGGERITLTRRGKPLAAIVSVKDLQLLEELEDRLDLADAKAALKEPGSIPWERIKIHDRKRD